MIIMVGGALLANGGVACCRFPRVAYGCNKTRATVIIVRYFVRESVNHSEYVDKMCWYNLSVQ